MLLVEEGGVEFVQERVACLTYGCTMSVNPLALINSALGAWRNFYSVTPFSLRFKAKTR